MRTAEELKAYLERRIEAWQREFTKAGELRTPGGQKANGALLAHRATLEFLLGGVEVPTPAEATAAANKGRANK